MRRAVVSLLRREIAKPKLFHTNLKASSFSSVSAAIKHGEKLVKKAQEEREAKERLQTQQTIEVEEEYTRDATDNILEWKEGTEVQDPDLIFNTVWKRLEEKFGKQNLVFPKETYWLVGAPGAGKGTMCKYIMGERGITSEPIVTSSLLDSPEMKILKSKGQLINDSDVIELLFIKLLDQENYANGVIVDGFPRTIVQAQCISLLYDKMISLYKEFRHTKEGEKFSMPKFRLCILYVDEKLSVERQLSRGRVVRDHNARVRETGIGELKEERDTDVQVEAAKKRYKFFKDSIYESIKVLASKFSYNLIDASGSIDQVAQNIIEEFKYQSSMELGKETFDSLNAIPPAEDLTRHARQQLVRRLDYYQFKHTEVFNKVIQVIQREFLHIMQRQSLTGVAVVRSENEIFKDNSLAINMLLDILTERGYQVILDLEKKMIPYKIDPKTNEILTREIKVLHFQIQFEKPKIRS